MSQEVVQLKKELFREALTSGWYAPTHVSESMREICGEDRISRWYARLYEAPTEAQVPSARFLNNFLIGADPEFMFISGGGRMDARLLNLKAGLAFGADNNGRLVELRPEPHRSCLAVLSSIWLTMRWLGVYTPKTLPFAWRAGAYCEQDGLGGHIHYGRKREHLRTREVASLDRITHLLFTAGIFDREEGRLRFRQGQGGHYGGLGDIRKQPHGYEYRSLPSWMDSPWLAYFNLVVGKLVVALPELLAPLSQADHTLTAEQARGQLRLLLAHLRPLDDDARLAYAILSRQGFPQHNSGADLKAAWGIFAAGPFGQENEKIDIPQVYPRTVPSHPEAEEELAQAMFEARAPQLALQATWRPLTLPKGYSGCINDVDTRQTPGLGEFVADLCVHEKCHLFFKMQDVDHAIYVDSRYKKAIAASPLLKDFDFGFHPEYKDKISLRNHLPLSDLMELKHALLKTDVLPMWNIKDVQADSFEKWEAAKTPVVKTSGRPIFSASFGKI